jgi:DNA-binding NtrC family response regulator
MDRLVFSLGHAYGMAEIASTARKGCTNYGTSYGIIGDSPVMQKLFKGLEKTYREECSVLIEGETGTGKELVANAIHFHSNRSGNPLVTLNCGAFPKDLIQAELFGHEKGAFTGAVQQKIGRIESAQGGTLFLDEIGDLPLDQQVNLLRFLEERAITRIGGSAKIPVDVRIIAATHVDLKAAVQKGTFREDLFYRLQVLQLKTPPLRERLSDIELLAWHYFHKFSANSNKYKAKGFNSDALHLIRKYTWPGNVRELINSIRNAVVMSENRLLSPIDLNLDKRNKIRTQRTLDEARALADRESIISCMYLADSNISRAAELLGITRVSLHRLIKKYQLECGSTSSCSSCANRDKCFWVTPEGQSEARSRVMFG